MMLRLLRRGYACALQVAYRRVPGTSDGLKFGSKQPWFLSSRSTTTVAPVTYWGSAVTKDERREFMAVFPDIVRELTDAGRHLDIPDARKWFAKVLQYNVPGGKRDRGLALVFAFRTLARPDQLTAENLRLAYVMGWSVEMLQAFFLLMDDVIQGAETRRGRPCWYRHGDIGTAALNDGILLESGLYQLLRRHLSDKPYYVQALELFHEATLKTAMGRTLDLLASRKPDFSKFTMDHYSAIVKYKTAYYSFHLPVALAMLMAGVRDEEVHRQAKTILLEMGHFLQVQRDYLDCFGDRPGTDVRNGKCTWLAVVALQRATPEQRALFERSYGTADVAAVRDLYEALGVRSTFAVYEEETYNLISTHIQQVSRGLPHRLFFKLLDKICRRE